MDDTKTPTWLGEKLHQLKMSLGDFGYVWATVSADIFYTKKQGYTVKITSCKLLLFTKELEFLHRLTGDARQELEYHFLSEVSSSEDDSVSSLYDF